MPAEPDNPLMRKKKTPEELAREAELADQDEFTSECRRRRSPGRPNGAPGSRRETERPGDFKLSPSSPTTVLCRVPSQLPVSSEERRNERPKPFYVLFLS